MANTATELKNLITKLKKEDSKTAYTSLEAKCRKATIDMIEKREDDCVVELENSDLPALEVVTEKLRGLGYRFRFIERENASGEFVTYRLLISIRHCK